MLRLPLQRYIIPLLAAAALLVVTLKPGNETLGNLSFRVQQQLNKAEGTFAEAVRDKIVLQALQNSNVATPAVSKLADEHLWLYYYQDDTLKTWTQNKVLPPRAVVDTVTTTTVVKLKNGWYQLMKYEVPNGNRVIVGLTAIKHEYPFENKFLSNRFALYLNVPDNVELSNTKVPGATEVTNRQGQFMFSLYNAGEGDGVNVNLLVLIAQLLLLLLLLYYVNVAVQHLRLAKGFWPAFVLLALLLFLLRAGMLLFSVGGEMDKLDLFNPKYYASSIVTKSLGDLLLNAALLGWLVFFYMAYRPVPEKKRITVLRAVWLTTITFSYTALVLWVFKTLVMDSVISFEVYNILSLDGYSLLGLLTYSLLLATHFVVARRVMLALLTGGITFRTMALCTGLVAAVFSLFAINSPFYHVILYTALWTLLLQFFLYRMLAKDAAISVRNLILYVSVYGLLTTFLIENLYERKERNMRYFFATKLGNERDYVAEYMFKDVAARIAEDAFINKFAENPLIPKKEAIDRLNALYLSGYYNKYDLRLFVLGPDKAPARGEDSLLVAPYVRLLSYSGSRGLLYVPDSTQNYSYVSTITLRSDTIVRGYLILKLTPKVYYGQNVYPELLVGGNIATYNNAYNYSYAVYKHDRLVAQFGDFPYTYKWNKDYRFDGQEHVFIEEPDWEHGIMQFEGGKKAIVSVGREPVFEPVATFSYLFTFSFLFSVILLVGTGVWEKGLYGEGLLSGLSLSFRTRINYSMLAMIVLSFIVIGIITISFFSNQYDKFYSDRLQRKEKVVHAGLEYFIQQNTANGGRLNAGLDVEVARLAGINSVDINLFDLGGNLIEASQPAIYEKGIISKKMNPGALFALLKAGEVQVNVQERIGNLSYLAAYAPLRGADGNTAAFLGIPYFERSKEINSEVSGFLVALMNVYVFLLICAAVLAYFVSNSITRPLTIISDKLRILNLNKKNEPIQWNSRDEIGVLIGEYNKMIAELERSAQKLARSERESAWREMAKQIAHEIKNPLTPMKLSIQYLQRAIDAGNPNIEELARRVTKTLEEQIENLSSIATAFSSFAKMPRPENEILNLNDLLKPIAELFSKEAGAEITFTTDSQAPLVYADKNQLISVFNNLVKNAIQSIPEGRTGFIDINVKDEDGLVIVTVSDNGSGIPQDNYDKVFVPNFTTKSSGTGLGLAISKRIIDGLGGKIWFESAENVGTAFYVRLNREAGDVEP